jgi:hypothetical protein
MAKRKPFHVLLIPSDGSDSRKLRQRFLSPDVALIMARPAALNMFRDQLVEIVVIETASREAVRNDFIGGANNA